MITDSEFYDHLPLLQMWAKTVLNAYGPDSHHREIQKFHHQILYMFELALCHYPYSSVVGTDSMLEGSLARDPEYAEADLIELRNLIPGIYYYADLTLFPS